jgi:PPOX class probable F420-dependent enzyme
VQPEGQGTDLGLALDRARELGIEETGLAVVVTLRADGSAQASVVNAGVLDHPVTGKPAVGFVARGGARKPANLRARPRVTVVFRSGWEWVAVEGDADLAGPDDDLEGVEAGAVHGLVREIYSAAVGGSTDDWGELDNVIAAEGHTAVLVRPARVYSNPGL